MSWKRLSRKTVVTSKYLTVYQDNVRLPNGHVVPGYTLVKKPNIVIIVATTSNGDVLMLYEYKYAADQTLLTLPTGHINNNESPLDAARRELLEETGYQAEKYKLIAETRDYPNKDMHTVYVVSATHIEHLQDVIHEQTEEIKFEITTPSKIKRQVSNKEWKVAGCHCGINVMRGPNLIDVVSPTCQIKKLFGTKKRRVKVPRQ